MGYLFLEPKHNNVKHKTYLHIFLAFSLESLAWGDDSKMLRLFHDQAHSNFIGVE